MERLTDLHIHTTASDGTDTPAEILLKIRAAGIRVFAITDHDTVSGAMEIRKRVPEDMCFIPGVEFSCSTEAGRCHILGLGYDPEVQAFRDILRKGEILRKRKLVERVAFLRAEKGVAFTEEEIRALRARENVGKPHIADLLIAKGLAADTGEAIRLIDQSRVPSVKIPAGEAIRAIGAAGGMAVWAHPLGGEGDPMLTDEEFRAQLCALLEAGIQGLECWYSRYHRTEIDRLLAAARAHGLYISGGSDYHGTRKSIRLGTLNADGVPVYEEALTVLRGLGGEFE